MDETRHALHTGQALPRRLLANVANWNPEKLTPGWLASLPGTVAELCERWEIALDPVIQETEITLVLLGRSRSLGPVVIKSSPLADEFAAEATALRLAASDTVARVYDVDLERSVMVIERIVPGTQLRDVAMSDDEATYLAAELVATLWRPVPDPAGLHPLRRWMRALMDDPPPDRIDPDLVRNGQETATALLSGTSREVLLHGDFQHHNVLRRSTGSWAIIDPKGVVGNPGFEIAAWMYNPPAVTAREDYAELARRRVAIFADVWGIDRQELFAWAFAGAVLSACWAVADPMPAHWSLPFVRGAEVLWTLVS